MMASFTYEGDSLPGEPRRDQPVHPGGRQGIRPRREGGVPPDDGGGRGLHQHNKVRQIRGYRDKVRCRGWKGRGGDRRRRRPLRPPKSSATGYRRTSGGTEGRRPWDILHKSPHRLSQIRTAGWKERPHHDRHSQLRGGSCR